MTKKFTQTSLAKETGLNKTQAQALIDLGVEFAGDLAELTVDDLTDIGVKVVTARKLVKKWSGSTSVEEAPATVPMPSFPTSITVRTGKPEDMPLRELLQAVADGERTPEYLNALRLRTQGMDVYVRKEGEDGLDVDAVMEIIEFAEGNPASVPEFWGTEPVESLEEILERRKMANPITGAALAKGDAWLDVSEENRILAAFGRIARHLKGNEDEYTLIRELSQDKLVGRWVRISSAYKRAVKSNDVQAIQAQQALYATRRGGAGSPSNNFRIETRNRPNF